MNILIIIFRAIFYYFLILFSFKLIIKKQNSIFLLLISTLSAVAIIDYKQPLAIALIPILIILILDIILSRFISKDYKFDSIEYEPSIIIKNGKINFKVLERNSINIDEILLQIRDKGIKTLDEIEYAVLESNNKLSIFLYDDQKTYPLPLIIDGEIQYNSLNDIGKTKRWIISILKDEKTNLNEVFYAFYKNDKCFIIKKSD